MEEVLKLFVLGIAVSFGPCIAHCALVILPYIAATTQSWKGGLKAILIFSVARLAVYGALGLLAGLMGQTIIEQLLQFQFQIMAVGGTFIASLGLLIFLRKNEASRCGSTSSPCTLFPLSLSKGGSAHRAGIRGSALLGLFAGILPCLPLLGVLTFTALHAQGLWHGASYGLAFGAGKLLSPLILLGMLAGGAPALLSRYGRVFGYFTRLCGIVLILIGISLIVPGLLPLWW